MRKLNSSNFLWGAYRRPKKEEKDDFKKWIWDRRSEEMKSGLEKKNYKTMMWEVVCERGDLPDLVWEDLLNTRF